MTVVARIVRENVPLLIGDLLLSGIYDPTNRVVLPTTDDVPVDAESQISPKGLHQKLALIGDNVIIGWAGKLQTAQDVIGELEQRSVAERFDFRSLDEYFNRQRASTWLEVSIIGIVKESDTSFKPFGRAYMTVKTPVLGCESIGLIGSGAQKLAQVLVQDEHSPTTRLGSTDELGRSVCYALRSAGMLLQGEIYVKDSLSALFGGGYELASLIDGKCSKLDSITYVFWEAHYDGVEILRFRKAPLRAFRYEYQGDLLVIRSLEFLGPGDRVSSRVFPVPPVYRYLTSEERSSVLAPDMNGSFLCSFILVTENDNPLQVLTLVGHRANRHSWVRFDDGPEGLGCHIEEGFLNSITGEIVSYLKRKR